MLDLNDFYAFKTTTSNNNYSPKPSKNYNTNNSGSPLIWIAAIISILWIVGKLLA